MASCANLPPFDQLSPQQAGEQVQAEIENCRATLEKVLAEEGERTWDNTVAPLEHAHDALERAFSPLSHLNSVLSGDWRPAYEAALKQATAYWAALGQNHALYEAYRALAQSPQAAGWSQCRRRALELALRDFHLAGVALEGQEKQKFAGNVQRLSELSSKFANNVLDASNAWQLHLADDGRLGGLPESARQQARAAAERRQLDGYCITLDIPCYLAVMTHADDRELRREVHLAYVTRASEQGPQLAPEPGAWDNGPVMREIMHLRAEQARLLGYDNYAEVSLASKMAEHPEAVVDFLRDLAARARPAALEEYAALQAFAADELGIAQLQPWDITWVAEKLREARYDLNEEQLRPYFPFARVRDGMFAVAGRLFDIQVEADPSVPTWHADAEFFWVLRGGERIAGFYLDPFARDKKRGGAWMDTVAQRRRSGETLQLPVAYLVCNFSQPTENLPSLLTHNEVTTLFHEFGHGLHHMLTRVETAAVSGINGVPWDAVEVPSQFLENWCWQEEVLDEISGHYQSGELLPGALRQKLLAAKNFQSAMQTVRQLEFALFDFLLHREYDRETELQVLLDQVRTEVSVVPVAESNRFQHSFSHIFAGGYAAGYYSYKWAEVLSADAFSLFEEKGIYDSDTGRRFLQTILEQGGSREITELFVEFRGRAPEVDALLRHSGISETAGAAS